MAYADGRFPEDPGRGNINTTFNLYARGDGNDTPIVMFHEDESTYNNVSALTVSSFSFIYFLPVCVLYLKSFASGSPSR